LTFCKNKRAFRPCPVRVLSVLNLIKLCGKVVHLRKMLSHDFSIKQKYVFVCNQVNHNAKVLGLVVFLLVAEQLKNGFVAKFWRCFNVLERSRVLKCER